MGFAKTQSQPPTSTINKKSEVPPDKLPVYQIGSGATYNLALSSGNSDVTIGFVEQTAQKLVVEIAMKSSGENDGLNATMLQQFQLGLVGGKIQILKGIMKIPMIEKPQILPAEYLEGFSGVQVKSFLIGSSKDIDGKKVGEEAISAGGKTYQTTHYRHVENGQTIDYWISDAAKPMGLIKIESSGSSQSQNYKMTLKNSVSGVTTQINERDAEPLNDTAKTFLPMLLPGLSNHL